MEEKNPDFQTQRLLNEVILNRSVSASAQQQVQGWESEPSNPP